MKFWVMWTYEQNYSPLMRTDAVSAEEAVEKLIFLYSDDFRQKANIYVWDKEPIMHLKPAPKLLSQEDREWWENQHKIRPCDPNTCRCSKR